MTFPYSEITSKISRPIIPIILKSKTKVMLYSGLVDSGADHSIFSLDVAKALEIKLTPKAKIQFFGAGKDTIEGFWSKIELRVSGKIYITKVIFADISQFDHGILGQLGFFDHFDVKLSHQKQTVEIEPVKLTN